MIPRPLGPFRFPVLCFKLATDISDLLKNVNFVLRKFDLLIISQYSFEHYPTKKLALFNNVSKNLLYNF
jgi:hypothetical protein